MKKSLLFLLTAVLLLLAGVPVVSVGALPAAAEVPLSEVFTAQVTLLDMEEGEEGQWTFHVALPNGQTSIVSHRGFLFANARGTFVTPEEFFAANENKLVTIDFTEIDTGLYWLVECAGGGYRASSTFETEASD